MFGVSFSPAEIQAFSFAFLFFVTGIVSLFVLTTNFHDPIARTFGLLGLFAAIINILSFSYHVTENLELARLYRVVSQFFTLPFAAYLILLGLRVYESRLPKRIGYRAVGYALIALILLFFTPPFIFDLLGGRYLIGDVIASPSIQLSPKPGPLLIYLIGAFLFSTLYATYLFALLLRRNAPRDARVLGALLILSVSIPTLARTASWAPWYDIGGVGYVSLFVSLLGGPIFAFGTAYAILRHRLFNLRLIAAELFIFGLWTFIFFKTMLAPTIRAAVPDIILLSLSLVLGVFLIRSVLKEVESREKLQVLTGKLRQLNERLEERVTERTVELDRSKIHVEQIIENLTVGLVEYTDERTVIRINRATEDLLGISRESVVGRRFYAADTSFSVSTSALRSVLFPETADVYVKPETEQPAGARIEEVTIEQPSRRELQLTTAPIRALESKKRGFITLIRDISREKQIDRTKSEFLTVAAHQLRTPLTAMRWSLKLLLEKGTGRLSKAQREILADGNRAGENMLRIINDLLNVVRLEEGRSDFRFTPDDLSALVRHVVAELAPAAKEKSVRLDMNVPVKFPRIDIDAEKMHMAVSNIVDNAVRYTLPEGSVRVSLSGAKDHARLIVADTGIGIMKEDQQRLFSKFFRAKRAMKMFTDGSGLGLYIAKNIIDRHGGTITAASDLGVGTTITIELPLQHTERGGRKATPATANG